MSETNIEWTKPPGFRGESWNFVRGCSRTVAAGAGGRSECGDKDGGGCYAERDGGRWCGPGGPYEGLVRLTGKGPRWTGSVAVLDEKLDLPARQKAPRCYFVASTSDPFHEDVNDAVRDSAFASMALAPRHRYILLTKHGADNGSLRRYILDPETPRRIAEVVRGRMTGRMKREEVFAAFVAESLAAGKLWPLPGLVLGVSVGLQASAKARIPELLAVPAWRRLISVEPLLEAVDLDLSPARRMGPDLSKTTGIDWLIVGGESGPGARPCDVDWIRDVLFQARQAKVPVFVKQLGAVPTMSEASWLAAPMTPLLSAAASKRAPGGIALCLRDRKGGDPAEWPADLRVRQYPSMALADRH